MAYYASHADCADEQRPGVATKLLDFVRDIPAMLIAALKKRHQQRIDRAAFNALLDKDDWVYRDMGISKADVEWASRLPMDVNAAFEMEKLRQAGRML